ncbi:hypothetical protein PF007_g19500 [Phytophthora fragariae]|uniref:WLGC domain-containing protein n=1 Tax=Phytophthora fragariae TaxID=53985 RepID=A0A6A3R5J6_9STRA|nr:hypothetical protein PF007_g19500 [Phytophthora fragariae]
MMTKLSRASISDARLSVANIFATEVATFYDVFGVLGVPMLILFGVSAGWTFMLAAIQVHADTMANTIMKTTEFDNGEFWLLPKADTGIIIAAVVLLTLFGIGYTALAVTMVFFYHAGVPKEADLAQSRTVSPVAKNSRSSSIQIAIPRKGILVRFVQRGIDWFRGLSSDVCEHYFTAALDLPKLVFQSATLYTYLRQGFPTPIIYYYSVLLLCSWLVTSYRSQHYAVDPNLIITRLYYTFDLFFAVFAPLVVLIYYIYTFKFDRAEFLTRSETLSRGIFDNVARIFAEPSQISSFCNAFHYLQFSSGTSLFYKSALNLLSLYKWRKIILTLIHNHNERQLERKLRALVGPAKPNMSRAGTIKAVITRKLSSKPKMGNHFAPKLFLSLIFFAAGVHNFVYAIGSVHSTTTLCSKYDKCALYSYWWNFELKRCQRLEQLILIYTKTIHLPEWLSMFTNLEYLHVEGDFTNRRLQTIPDGIFDSLEHLSFLHLGTLPELKTLPSMASLKNVRYLTLAVLSLLKEIPSFEGLSSVSDLNLIHLPSAPTLPSLTPLKRLAYMGIQARSAVCCNGYISGTCNMTESQCLPIANESHPLVCTDERISAHDKAELESFGSTIRPLSTSLDLELAAPSQHSTDELCGGVMYKECSFNGKRGMCYNSRMMVINCETTSSYINMRKLQIQRGVGKKCDPDVEAWLGCPSD